MSGAGMPKSAYFGGMLKITRIYENSMEYVKSMGNSHFGRNGPLQKALYSLGNIDVSAPGAQKCDNPPNSNKNT